MKVAVNWSFVIGVSIGTAIASSVLIPAMYKVGEEMYGRGKQAGAQAMNDLWTILYNVEHHNIPRKDEP